MAKITLDPMLGSYASITALNSRFQQIEDAFNDDVLWRNNPVGETNTMMNDLDMNGYTILNVGTFSSVDLYLGAFAVAPTERSPGVPLTTDDEGVLYFNTADNSVYVWTGTVWSSLASAATSASAVSIVDSGGFYTATDVEAALQELPTTLASTATGEGASTIGVEDVGGYLTATDVEAALQELAAAGGSGMTYVGTQDMTGLLTTQFTIPAGARRIRVVYDDIQISTGVSALTVQLGGASGVPFGTFRTTFSVQPNGVAPTVVTSTTTSYILGWLGGTDIVNGTLDITKSHDDTWVITGQAANQVPEVFSGTMNWALTQPLTTVAFDLPGAVSYLQGYITVYYE